MSDSQVITEIASPAELVENVKEAMRDYADFGPNPKLYPNLTAQDRQKFSQGTYEQREEADLFENRNPYNPEKFIDLIRTAKLMLESQGRQNELIEALNFLLDHFNKSKPDRTGRRVSQQQVEALQDLLRRTLEAID